MWTHEQNHASDPPIPRDGDIQGHKSFVGSPGTRGVPSTSGSRRGVVEGEVLRAEEACRLLAISPSHAQEKT